jgi:hypothetical protein
MVQSNNPGEGLLSTVTINPPSKKYKITTTIILDISHEIDYLQLFLVITGDQGETVKFESSLFAVG